GGSASATASLAVNPVPTAQMRTSVTSSIDPIPIGSRVWITVHAADAVTGTPVSGYARISGSLYSLDFAFAYTFGSSPPSGVVSAPNYVDATIQWPQFTTHSVSVAGLDTGIGTSQL